jgi:uncharacterized membrane protein YgcG
VGLLSAFRRRPFLTPTEQQQLADGVAHACRHARARISLVIDEHAKGDPEARALTLLREWELPEAERPTAVLIYACAATRQFAVVGGEAIRRIAPPAFWDQVRGELQRHFEDERYCDGLFKAVAQVAIELHRHAASTSEETIGDDPMGSDRAGGDQRATGATP